MDCEPPAVGGPPALPPLTVLRRRPCAPTPLRSVPPPAADNNRVGGAAAFADAALRRVLEVLDRRRPLTQLRPLLAPGLVDSLLSHGGRADIGAAAARLRRVYVQPVTAEAAEVAATYSRGSRLHAIACRVEQSPSASGPRWQVVALHMG